MKLPTVGRWKLRPNRMKAHNLPAKSPLHRQNRIPRRFPAIRLRTIQLQSHSDSQAHSDTYRGLRSARRAAQDDPADTIHRYGVLPRRKFGHDVRPLPERTDDRRSTLSIRVWSDALRRFFLGFLGTCAYGQLRPRNSCYCTPLYDDRERQLTPRPSR